MPLVIWTRKNQFAKPLLYQFKPGSSGELGWTNMELGKYPSAIFLLAWLLVVSSTLAEENPEVPLIFKGYSHRMVLDSSLHPQISNSIHTIHALISAWATSMHLSK